MMSDHADAGTGCEKPGHRTLSPAGLARRHAMLGELQRSLVREVRVRRARRRAAAGAAAMLLLAPAVAAVVVWSGKRAAPDLARDTGARAVPHAFSASPEEDAGATTAPAPAKTVVAAATSIPVVSAGDEHALAVRVVANAAPVGVKMIGDAELLGVLGRNDGNDYGLVHTGKASFVVCNSCPEQDGRGWNDEPRKDGGKEEGKRSAPRS